MLMASADDALAHYAVARGLVGQRGPLGRAVLEAEHAAIAKADALLPYDLPSPAALAAVAPHLRALLEDAATAPTDAQVDAALANARAAAPPAATHAEVLAAFEGNFALIGATPAAPDDARGGLEEPHAVRWLPTACAHGATAARVAVLEHLAARCAQLADGPSTSASVKASLRDAAATLKLAQMEPLYQLREAVAYDEPARAGVLEPTEALVTRPCALVRGALAFPVGTPLASARGCPLSEAPMGDDGEAKKALQRCASQTTRVRAEARARGEQSSAFVAPDARELAYAGASTGTLFQPAEDLDVAESVTPADFSVAQWLLVVRRAAVALHAMEGQSSRHVARLIETAGGDLGTVSAENRRDGLWTEFRRHVGISQDRLWLFLRLVSGVIGSDVTDILTAADESAIRAAKDVQAQRLEVAKKVADAQAKVIDTVIGSMAKASSLALDASEGALVVVDEDVRKQLHDLASGQSGRPLYEANVALRVAQSREPEKIPLSKLLSSISTIGASIQQTMENSLTVAAGASLTELSHPCNSYFVSLREDTVAAIRVAHEVLNVELSMRGARRVNLWELVEGGCQVLVTRFATFVAYSLVQARSSTGVSAMYVSHTSISTNAAQARSALGKLVGAAMIYTQRVSPPKFFSKDGRKKAMEQGSAVEDVDVGVATSARRGNVHLPLLRAPISASGWYIR